MTTACTHLAELPPVQAQTPDGCAECLAAGGHWVHLRLCLSCGHVGCCDSSPGKHATAHFHQERHPVVRSFEPGEEWRWCYVDEVVL
jgi:CPA1 family monovalent cation:H+ antiporter